MMDNIWNKNGKSFLKIGAPMVRYSKLAFRETCRSYGADIMYTPMILAAEFASSQFARDADFRTNSRDQPLVVQFGAKNSKELADAAQIVEPYVQAVDVNCGCPQRWAVQEGIGAYLMSQPELVADMVKQVRLRTNVPCTVKIRIHKDLRETVEFVKRVEKMGVEWITVHGRTRHMKSTVPPDYDAIKLCKESVNCPVMANGDVYSLKDAEQIVEKTGVDGVMSARGLLQNPALFSGAEYTPLECIQQYVNLAIAYGTPFSVFHHHIMYMMETTMSKAEKRTFNVLSSIPSVLDYLEEWYNIRYEPMAYQLN